MLAGSMLYLPLLFFFGCISLGLGHVKLFYTPGELSIRNGLTSNADGVFSVSGPCGGSDTYGKNGINQITEGTSVQLKINYNGGHDDAANLFRVTYRCSTSANTLNSESALLETNGATALSQTDCTAVRGSTSVTYPVAAPDISLAPDGYTITCNLPPVSPDADGTPCTMSALDQRNWGGCIDLNVNAAPTPAPNGAPVQSPTTPAPTPQPSILGSYYVDKGAVGAECSTCTISSGTLLVKEISGTETVVEGVMYGSCDDSSTLPAEYQGASFSISFTDNNRPLLTPPSSGGQWIADVDLDGNAITVATQPFRVTVVSGLMQMENIGTTAPFVCDAIATTTMSDVGARWAIGVGGMMVSMMAMLFV